VNSGAARVHQSESGGLNANTVRLGWARAGSDLAGWGDWSRTDSDLPTDTAALARDPRTLIRETE